MFFAPTIIYFL